MSLNIDIVFDVILNDAYLLIKNKYKNNGKNNNKDKNISFEINDIFKNIDYTNLHTLIQNDTYFNLALSYINKYITIYVILYIHLVNINNKNIDVVSNEIKNYILKHNLSYLTSDDKIHIYNNFNIIFNILQIINNKHINNKNINNKNVDYYYNIIQNALHNIDDYNDKICFIIKIIIFLNIYEIYHKKDINQLIELSEFENTESTYIDVIENFIDVVNYNTLSSLFSKNNTNIIYNMLNDSNFNVSNQNSTSNIIYNLFKSNILFPITDDILRYNKDVYVIKDIDVENNASIKNLKNENKTNNFNDYLSKTKNSKIKEILTNINSVIYNNDNTILHKTLLHKKALIINEFDEINVLYKYSMSDVIKANIYDYIKELTHYRIYSFISIKKNVIPQLTINFPDIIKCVRYCCFDDNNVEYYKNNLNSKILYRSSNDYIDANIVGLMVNNIKLNNILNNNFDKILIDCIKINDVIKVDYNILSTILNNTINSYIDKNNDNNNENNLILKNPIYYIFNKKYDENNIINDLFKLNKTLTNISYEFILNKINKLDHKTKLLLTVEKIKDIINNEQNKLFCLDNNLISNIISTTYHDIITKTILKKGPNYKYDMENKIAGITSKLILLPTYTKLINNNVITKIKKTEFLNIKELDLSYQNYSICQHKIMWSNLHKFQKNNIEKYNKYLYIFINKYVELYNNSYVCISCGENIPIEKYIDTGFSDTININIPLEFNLESIEAYEKYVSSIKNIEKIIEKISAIVNIPIYFSSSTISKHRRQEIIKNVIDVINIQYKSVDTTNINLRKEILETSAYKYGTDININKSYFYIFLMNNDIFKFSSNDVDKYKKFKINTTITYVLFFLILNLEPNEIKQFKSTININYKIYDKYFKKMFDNYRIIFNNKNDVQTILNYNLLCYVIYFFACIISKNNILIFDNPEFNKNKKIDIKLISIIINNFIILLNNLVKVDSSKNDFLFNIINNKFFIKLEKIYNNNSSISKEIINFLFIDDNIIVEKNKKHIYQPFNITDYSKKYDIFNIPLTKYILKPLLNPTYSNIHNNKKYKSLLSTYDDNDINSINKKLYDISINKIFNSYDDNGTKYLSVNNKNNIDDNKIINSVNKILLTKINDNVKNVLSVQNNNYHINNNNTHFDEIDKNIKNLIDGFNFENKHNTYIINHSIIGNLLSSDQFIIIDENNITIRNNIKDFHNKQVYVCHYKKITYYYDFYNLNYLGYNENNIINKIYNSDKILIINYSTYFKLLNLGHYKINYKNIEYNNDDDNKYKKYLQLNEIHNIISTRMTNLKKSINFFKKSLFSNNNKKNSLKIYLYNNNNLLFNNNFNNLHINRFNNDISIDIEHDYIKNINKYKNNDLIILHYICNQIAELLKINSKIEKHIILLIEKYIDNIFNDFMYLNNSLFNNEIKKIINSTYNNVVIKSNIDDLSIIDDNILNQNIDNKEINDGIDVDIDKDDDYDDNLADINEEVDG